MTISDTPNVVDTSATLWAVPWPLVVLLLVVTAGGMLARRRRRQIRSRAS